MTERSVKDHLARHYDRQVARIADKLRNLADSIENKPGDGRRLRDAMDIEHALRWGVANLPIDTLFEAAREYDDYEEPPTP